MSQPVDANHLPQEILAAYALRLGTVNQEFVQHIEQCEICTREVTTMISLQYTLKKKIFRFDCPSEEKLVTYALHSLPLWERTAIKAHLQNCRYCIEEVRVIQQTEEEASSPFSTLWEAAHRIKAALLPQLPQYSFRDLEEAGEPRPTLSTFTVDEVTVRLSRSKGKQEKFFLTGMLESPSGLAVRLLQVTETQPSVLISEVLIETDGFFDLGLVSPGIYQLEVLLSDRLIEIGSLHI